MSNEDKELEILKAKRLAEMQKNLSIQDKLDENKSEENEKPKPVLMYASSKVQNEEDIKSWKIFLEDLGYKSWEETNNPAYKLFLGAQTH